MEPSVMHSARGYALLNFERACPTGPILLPAANNRMAESHHEPLTT